MVQIPGKVKGIIEKYLATFKENNIPVNQTILFGSYAKGKYDDWSDIDLALISEIFEGIRIKDRNKIRLILCYHAVIKNSRCCICSVIR